MSDDRPNRPAPCDPSSAAQSNVFIAGLSGAVGGLLAEALTARRTPVSGILRRPAQREHWRNRGVDARIGDLATIDSGRLSELVADTGARAVVYAAGSNGGAKEITQAIDLDALIRMVEAAVTARVTRFVLVSVFPEAWRERDLSDEEEFYFAAKKRAEIHLSTSPLDWIILRPALLTDDPATGEVDLGPAQTHGEISRADVAATLVELLATPKITRQILELTGGATPIREAVQQLV